MINSQGAGSGAIEPEKRQSRDEALEASLNSHAGDWVAVSGREIIDTDRNLGDLVGRLNGHGETAEVFKIEPGPDASCST
jgi:hypothetical protein